VPFYLSYLAGAGIQQLAADGQVPVAVRRRAVLAAVIFALGVITVFMALGATATMFGQVFREWFHILRWVAAAIIIAMGLHFLGVIRIGVLYRQFKADTAGTTSVSLMAGFRRHLGTIEKAMGVLLIVFGVLIATNSINLIAQWMLDVMPWFTSIG